MESQLVVSPSQYDPDLKEHSNMAQHALDLSKGIRSEEDHKVACDFLTSIKDRLHAWESKINPSIQAANQLHKNLTALKKDVSLPLLKARDEVLQPAVLKWREAQAEKNRIEQERINRELRQQEEARRLELAAEMEKSGKVEEANALIEKPIEASTVVIHNPVNTEGVATRTQWFAEVHDIKALCRAVADGVIEPEYVEANMVALNNLARNLKESMAARWAPLGVTVTSKKILAVSRSK